MTEYMVNPAIKKKNSIVLDFLANTYLPQLESNPDHLVEICKLYKLHKEQCYSLKKDEDQSEEMQTLKKGGGTYNWFEREKEQFLNCEVFIHKAGLEEKL